jgi:3-hydroxyisobutyrate dehydrogenase-like beta-hydroxyacid dehydrogenase
MTTPALTLGLLHPGDMGHHVGRVLLAGGATVLVALADRSARTREFARAAGLLDVGDVDALVTRADLVLSIVVPGAALDVAEQVAAAAARTGRRPVFVDFNAVSPATARRAEALLAGARARFVDGCILGPPPSSRALTTFVVSGEAAPACRPLAQLGLSLQEIAGPVGQASALKMCFGALSKGIAGLTGELLIAAERFGVAGELDAALQTHLPVQRSAAMGSAPSMPAKAHRWIAEMREVAATFQEVGLPGASFEGLADFFALIAQTPLGQTRPDGPAPPRVLGELARDLSEAVTASQSADALSRPGSLRG